MTIHFMLDGFPAGDGDIGEEAYRRSWYVFAPGAAVSQFAQPGANNLQQAILAAQHLRAKDAGDIWISTDPQPPAEGWAKKAAAADPPALRHDPTGDPDRQA